MCVHEGRGQLEDCKGGSCSEGEGVRERGRGGEAVVDVFQNLGTLLYNAYPTLCIRVGGGYVYFKTWEHLHRPPSPTHLLHQAPTITARVSLGGRALNFATRPLATLLQFCHMTHVYKCYS